MMEALDYEGKRVTSDVATRLERHTTTLFLSQRVVVMLKTPRMHISRGQND